MLINTKDLQHLKENGNSTLADQEKKLKISYCDAGKFSKGYPQIQLNNKLKVILVGKTKKKKNEQKQIQKSKSITFITVIPMVAKQNHTEMSIVEVVSV